MSTEKPDDLNQGHQPQRILYGMTDGHQPTVSAMQEGITPPTCGPSASKAVIVQEVTQVVAPVILDQVNNKTDHS